MHLAISPNYLVGNVLIDRFADWSLAIVVVILLTPGVFSQAEVDTKRGDLSARDPKRDRETRLTSNELGVLLFQEGKYEEAASAFQRSIRIDPNFATPYYNLGTVFAEVRRYEEAAAAMKGAIRLDPTLIKARSKMCDIYLAWGRYGSAAECYEQLLPDVGDDPQSHSNYGVALMRSKRAKESVIVFEHVIGRYPPAFEWYNNLGVALLEIREYKRAVDALRRAIELQPHNESGRYNFAIALLANKNRSAALEQYGFLKNKNAALAEELFKAISNGRIVRPAH